MKYMITKLTDWKKIKIDENFPQETSTFEPNYMNKANLEKIKRHVDGMLLMGDEVLANIDPWAIDHLATSADDIDEVYNWLKSNNSKNLDEGLWDNIRKKRERLGVDKIGAKTSTFKSKKSFDKVAKNISDQKDKKD